MGFPVFAIESVDSHAAYRTGIQAADIYIDAIRIAARDVKAFNPADSAKKMLRYTGIESIFREEILTVQESEILPRHDQVQKSGHSAQGAIAVLNRYIGRGIHFKNNAAAMTAAAMGYQFRTLGH